MRVRRTGYLWAHQKMGKECEPDLLSAAKPLANGLPIGCVLMKQKVADAMQPGDHGSTFAGGPLVCRAALHVIERVQETGFLDNVKTNGEYLKNRLAEELKGHSMFKEVRGSGLLVGVQFTGMYAPLVKASRRERFVSHHGWERRRVEISAAASGDERTNRRSREDYMRTSV